MNTDKKTLMVRIIIFSLIMIGIIVLMRMAVMGAQLSTKYDDLAKCLTQKELKFYGAFWCVHCQAQKREFGGSVKYLPYIECSNPDGQGSTQVCIDNKIENFPTWVYPKELVVESETAPTFCDIQPGPATQPKACEKLGSSFLKTWTFSNVNVHSPSEPTHTGNTWTFVPGSRTTGEVQIPDLAKFSGCALPTENK